MKKETLLPPIHPGEILREEFLKPMEISINQLSRDIDVPPTRIHAIVHEERGITADTALRLSVYFGTTAELWMNLQQDYDLRIARRAVGAQILKRVRPRDAA